MEQKKPKKRHSLAVNGNMLSGTIPWPRLQSDSYTRS